MRVEKKIYLEKAAEISKDDMNLWCRYLNKYLVRDRLTEDIYIRLIHSESLTQDQKRILRESRIQGSYFNNKILGMTEKNHRKLESSDLKITDKAFQLLNDKLKENNLSLEITCAGGFVLQTLGIRATMDVDAFFYAPVKVQGLIESVGEELGINDEDETWLNNSIANVNKTPNDKYREVYKTFSNLTVYVVIPEYLIGMKLESGREKDFKDVAELIKKLKEESPKDLYNKLKDMEFHVDFADLLACFGDAYGHKWLAKYYKDHAEDLYTLM
jgi:hypothetical protein